MVKPFHKILIGLIVLYIFIYTGIPFEIENPTIESIMRSISFVFVFIILFFLFKQARRIRNKIFRIINYSFLGFLSTLFIIGASWNNIWVLEKNERNSWHNLEICINQSGTKILRQIRQTSGSIYDYRDRLVIYEFDKNNRISINTNVKYFKGPWSVMELKSNSKQRVHHSE